MQTIGNYTFQTGRERMCPMCNEGAALRYTGDTKEINKILHYKHRCIKCGIEFWFDGRYGD